MVSRRTGRELVVGRVDPLRSLVLAAIAVRMPDWSCSIRASRTTSSEGIVGSRAARGQGGRKGPGVARDERQRRVNWFGCPGRRLSRLCRIAALHLLLSSLALPCQQRRVRILEASLIAFPLIGANAKQGECEDRIGPSGKRTDLGLSHCACFLAFLDSLLSSRYGR